MAENSHVSPTLLQLVAANNENVTVLHNVKLTTTTSPTMTSTPLRALAAAILIALPVHALPSGAGTLDLLKVQAAKEARWSIAGGEVGFRFNTPLLNQTGTEYAVEGRRADGRHWLAVRDLGTLDFHAPYGMFEQFAGGSLTLSGALSFTREGRAPLQLADLKLIPVPGSSERVDVVDGSGTRWFWTSHAHFEFDAEHSRLSMFNMDLHAAEAFVQWFGDPNFADAIIGQLQIDAPVLTRGEILPDSCANPNWPGAPQIPGGPPYYEADVLLEALGAWQGGGCSPACTGPSGAATGMAKFTPSATLRNSNNPNTAEVPWWRKFSGNFPPYGNDQHPFLIWNTYRIDAATGLFVQIGRSGVKHAFLTINTGCAEPCNNGNILGKGCGDVYGVGNNDSNSDLGTRVDLFASAGRWGRCGSIWDPDCDGAINNPGITNFQYRNMVPEAELLPRSGGSEWLFDGWYLVRDDVNIYNTMGWRRFNPVFSSNTWTAPTAQLGPFTLGPVINRWVAPNTVAVNESHEQFKLPEGNLRIASKATDLGGGRWSYVIAVMNYDYGLPQIDPAQPNDPNLRLFRNLGLSGFELPVGATVENVRFHDGDGNPGNDWTIQQQAGVLRFTAPSGSGGAPHSNTLDWGTMFTFSFESTRPPVAAGDRPMLRLPSADGGPDQVLSVRVVAPAAVDPDVLLRDGFEG